MSLHEDRDKIIRLVGREGKRSTTKARVIASLDFPDITATGAIKATCANTRIAIEGQPIARYAGELSDHACVVLRQMIDQQYGFDPKREVARDACMQLCLENSFDPIVDYLNGLEW